MSQKPENHLPEIKRDDPMIAAEYALGLLEGEELLAARSKEANDEAFARRKDWWNNWFAPFTDEMAGTEPGADVWARIKAEITSRSVDEDSRVVDLQSRLRRWQWAAGATSAAAAVLLAVMVFSPGNAPNPEPSATGPVQMAAADPLVASIPIGDTRLRIGVTYLPASEEMLVSASGLTADGVHDHELWLVPDDGSPPQSLGVVVPGAERRTAVPGQITGNMGDGAVLVLTREPIGGKPDGEAAGPVVAEGAFSKV
jgi:anti-sigma-K factor RskA